MKPLNNQKDSLDSLFKEALNAHEIKPKTASFDEVLKRMDASSKPRIAWWKISIPIVLLLSIGITGYEMLDSNTPNTLVHTSKKELTIAQPTNTQVLVNASATTSVENISLHQNVVTKELATDDEVKLSSLSTKKTTSIKQNSAKNVFDTDSQYIPEEMEVNSKNSLVVSEIVETDQNSEILENTEDNELQEHIQEVKPTENHLQKNLSIEIRLGSAHQAEAKNEPTQEEKSKSSKILRQVFNLKTGKRVDLSEIKVLFQPKNKDSLQLESYD